MKTILLTIAVLLSACGAPAAAPAEQQTTAKAAATPEAKTVATENNPVVGDDEAPTGIMVLLAGQTLPACAQANLGQTFYVDVENQFKTCAADGWRVVDLRGEKGVDGKDGKDSTVAGPAGSKGDAGERGLQGDQGPAGIAGTAGVKGDKGDTGNAGAQGQQGIQGIAGTAGSQGPAGSNGTNGLNGLGAIGVFKTSNNALVGTFFGDSAVTSLMFSNGGIANLLPGTGAFHSAFAYYAGGAIMNAQCTFASNDCSGTCYVNNLSTPATATVKNTVFFTGAAWVKASGAEANGGAMTIRSTYYNGACNGGLNIASTVSFPVVTGWTLPAGLSMPIGSLYFAAQ